MGFIKPLFAAGLVVWAFAAAAYVASMVTVSWKLNLGSNGVDSSYNLFKRCQCINASQNKCNDFGWDPKGVPLEILLTRIIMIVAAPLILLATLVGVFGFCGDHRSIASEGILTASGAIFILVACGIFTGFTFNQSSLYGYSFFLAWISGGLFLLTGSLLCCSAYQKCDDGED